MYSVDGDSGDSGDSGARDFPGFYPVFSRIPDS